jgi:hypothetical protein
MKRAIVFASTIKREVQKVVETQSSSALNGLRSGLKCNL